MTLLAQPPRALILHIGIITFLTSNDGFANPTAHFTSLTGNCWETHWGGEDWTRDQRGHFLLPPSQRKGPCPDCEAWAFPLSFFSVSLLHHFNNISISSSAWAGLTERALLNKRNASFGRISATKQFFFYIISFPTLVWIPYEYGNYIYIYKSEHIVWK